MHQALERIGKVFLDEKNVRFSRDSCILRTAELNHSTYPASCSENASDSSLEWQIWFYPMEIPLEWDFLVDFEPTITISLVAGAR
jgi:hypothetical protein